MNQEFRDKLLDKENEHGHKTVGEVLNLDGFNKMIPHEQKPMKHKLFGIIGQIASTLTHHVSRERLSKLAKSDCRIIVMTGTIDNLVRPSNSVYLAKALKAEIIIFEGAGHCLFVEEPARYNSLVINHILGV